MFFSRNNSLLFTPKAIYHRGFTGHVIVVGNSRSATNSFYFRSRKAQFPSYSEVDSSQSGAVEQLLKHVVHGCQVVLVRDVALPLLRVLADQSDLFSSVVWFMDDDFPGAHSDYTLPKTYRKRLATWYRKASPMLARVCDQVWVSTPYLAQKYKLPESAILPPIEPAYPVPQPLIRCFYNGSSSHTQEWSFVYDIVKAVQVRSDNIWFEFIGDHALYKQFRGIPRVNILHPMSWPDYLEMTSHRTMDIGLAPLLDTPFNHARSHVKFLDITRQKAVGIYSRRFRRADEIEQSGAGLVVTDDAEQWVQAIMTLAGADRTNMRSNAQQLVDVWHERDLSNPLS